MRGRVLLAAAVAVFATGVAPVGAEVEAPPGGARATRAPQLDVASPQERHVRRLAYDLQNDGDPIPGFVEFLVRTLYEEDDISPARLVDSMQRVDEGGTATVEDLFSDLLRRTVDPASREFFVLRLDRIGRQKVAADLVASGEYFTRQGGGTNGGWVDAFYRDLLGRPADAGGRQYFLSELAAGRSRGSIASAVSGGAEGRRRLVSRLITELLRRPADAGGVSYYAGRLAAGWRVERVVTSIATSTEYVTKAQEAPRNAGLVLLGDGSRLSLFTAAGEVDETFDVTGLAEGEQVLDIDVRGATGVLYGVTSQSRLVAIATDGTADHIGGPIAGVDPDGLEVGIDFWNDDLHVTTGSVDVVVDPDTGAPTATHQLAYRSGDRHAGTTPDVHALAVRSVPVHPELVTIETAGLDTATDSLALLPESESSGPLGTGGPLHIDLDASTNGFDAADDAGLPFYAVLDTPHAPPSLWGVERSGEPRLLTSVPDDEVLGLALYPGGAAPDETAYVVAEGTSMITLISTRTWDTVGGPHLPVGLDTGTALIGLDVRPGGGGLFGIGSNGQVYGIVLTPQVATLSEIGVPLPSWSSADAADGVGFDIDPVSDLLQVTNDDLSWWVDLATGEVLGDASDEGMPETLTYASANPPGGTAPEIGGLAFTNSQRHVGEEPDPPESATAYGIDQTSDRLARLGSDGAVQWFGDQFLDVYDIEAVDGFDISPGPGQTAWALITSTGAQALIGFDLTTGFAHYRGTFDDETPRVLYTALAIA